MPSGSIRLLTMGSGYLFGLLFPAPAEARIHGFYIERRQAEGPVQDHRCSQNE